MCSYSLPVETFAMTDDHKPTDKPIDVKIDINLSTDKKVKATNVSLVCDRPNKTQSQQDDKQRSFFMMKSYQWLLALTLILGALLLVVYQTFLGQSTQPEQLFTVESGQSYYGLIPAWQSKVPLFSATLAKLYIKTQIDAPLYAGVYQLPANPTFLQVMQILEQGADIAMVKVQIIEGKTAKDLYATIKDTQGVAIEILDKSDDLNRLKQRLGIDATTPDGKYANNLEGWFAPDTYLFAKGSSDKHILTTLYDKQRQLLTDAWVNRDENLPYKSPYDALIMASIIEKETGIAEEREKVAAVFINRLRLGMRLQTDPTIIYGMGERYDGNIRRADIHEKTDYNTYQIDGLPPTPIALPSKAAINAAMHPADIDALYFVATGTGGHTFSNTLKEHNQAVQEYLKIIKNQ